MTVVYNEAEVWQIFDSFYGALSAVRNKLYTFAGTCSIMNYVFFFCC